MHVPQSDTYNKDLLKEEIEENSLTESSKMFEEENTEGTNKLYIYLVFAKRLVKHTLHASFCTVSSDCMPLFTN